MRVRGLSEEKELSNPAFSGGSAVSSSALQLGGLGFLLNGELSGSS